MSLSSSRRTRRLVTVIAAAGATIGLAGCGSNINAQTQDWYDPTDGVNNSGQIDPLTAAEAAKALGIKVYTIGAGRTGQVPFPAQDMFGNTQIVYQESQIDEATLQQVADITGGKYYRAEYTRGLRAIYDEINRLEKSQVEIEVFNQYFELFAWFLIPALLLLLLELTLRKTIFRRIP